MTRGHIYDQALELPPGHPFQLLGDHAVVVPLDKPVVDMVYKRHELVMRRVPDLEPSFGFRQLKDLFQNVLGKMFESLSVHHRPNL